MPKNIVVANIACTANMKFLVYGFLLPYGRAIMGGLIFSTIVTLFILPSIYVGLDNLNLWGRRVVRGATGKAAVTSGEGIEAA